MKTHVHQSDRERWKEARRPLITASDVANLLCESYAKTEAERAQQRDQLIMRKAELADDWEGNENTELASELEIPVIHAAAKRWGISISPHGWLDVDCECKRLGATSDAIWYPRSDGVGGFIPVNVKVSSCKPHEDCKPLKSGEPSTAAFAAGIPLYYRLQLQAEMAVHGTQHAGLLVLHYDRSLKLRMYIQSRHEAVIARIRSEVDRAWDDIEKLKAGKAA